MELSERCIQTLEKEGFLYVYEGKDEAGKVYGEHLHEDRVTIFVTEGSMELTLAGEIHKLTAGERLAITPQVTYYAVVGPLGCQYVLGEMVDGDWRDK